ncbi:MAG: hypothetical protein U1E50_02560 [Caulobacteraceae bacterium]
MNTPALPAEIADLTLDAKRPVIIVDVDEVLAMFMLGFGDYVRKQGYEMRVERFALFQNIYRPGDTEHLDMAAGRELFEAFFLTDVEHIEPAEHASQTLAGLSKDASVVILTNAPAGSRGPRGRWLAKHGFDYPMVINSGLKGPAVQAIPGKTKGSAAFIDDLLPNLESVAADAPSVARFQMVADARLRPLAPSLPDRHTRIDDWRELGTALAKVIRA